MNEHIELVKKHRILDRMVVRRIRENPSLMEIPRSNIERWIKLEVEQSMDGIPSDYSLLWKQILDTLPTEKILEILESEDPRYEQLQHGSPFVGILSQDEVRAAYRNGEAIPA